MKDLIIVGASGFGREVLQVCQIINKVSQRWNIKGFLDDNLKALDGYPCDYKVIGTIKDWQPKDNEEFVVSLAFPKTKKKVVESLLERHANIVSAIHPNVFVGDTSKVGKGVILFSGVGLTSNAIAGDYVIMLGGSYLGHDSSVGDYSTICAQCGINGHVQIGKEVFIGNHVCIAPSKIVGDGANIGIGSVVITNVKPGTSVFGNPARKV